MEDLTLNFLSKADWYERERRKQEELMKMFVLFGEASHLVKIPCEA